jgi:glucose dehydrogenase
MKPIHNAVASSIAIACAAAATIAFGQTAVTPAGNDWPQIAGNLGAQGYSALTQINKSNIKNLGLAWMTNLSAEPVTAPVAGAGGTATAQQTIPIVVDGVMYLNPPPAASLRSMLRPVPSSGNGVPSNAANGFGPAGQQRGVAVAEGKVYTTAAGNRMVALNKDTGAVVWAVVPSRRRRLFWAPPRSLRATTMAWSSWGRTTTPGASPSRVRASDGAMVWTFYGAYPHGTQFTDCQRHDLRCRRHLDDEGHAERHAEQLLPHGGAAPWQQGTIDPELGMIYIPFGNVRSCNGSQNGEGRPGDNLFGSSVVALDYKTGAYKWHFQAVRHDIWDMDNALTPVLADVAIGGETKKVIFYGSKSAFQFTLDRTNGKRRFLSRCVQSRATRATSPRPSSLGPCKAFTTRCASSGRPGLGGSRRSEPHGPELERLSG